jgi:hypothetical protein
MTKKIDTAAKELIKAVYAAAAELRKVAAAYTAVVEQRTGQVNPFIDVLDTGTIDSLIRERDRLAKKARKHDKS